MAGIDKAITVLFLIVAGAVVSIVLSMALHLITAREVFAKVGFVCAIVLMLSLLGILLMYMFQIAMYLISAWK